MLLVSILSYIADTKIIPYLKVLNLIKVVFRLTFQRAAK